ncbi:DUF5682 family protein [Acidipropionibacterium virtanenii]|uniref:Uncharacterized protein n=1 Tax=Acidipropionibacterium virtanenii TaxID=2057246 RepID=A0A344UT59_9ACTN|nr:DUF5682 family protein [Acidipropionibacterium virtanenii]AXE38457.1 hypothetical protein JS278_01281 [Acidipropionibacterium virtanenii]
MGVTIIGVRHHSPACARHVGAVIAAIRPRHVLIEGPADFNDRIDELLLGHRPPIAIFTGYRDGTRMHSSWSPLCDYSPEWVALQEGARVGAQLRFIDLPAWHPALADRQNRYADADQRYERATGRLQTAFGAASVDALWDRVFEVADPSGIGERLAAWFEMLRGGAAADESDAAREAHMASWVRAARHDGDDVVVVTGGFHAPALERLIGTDDGRSGWPQVPSLPEGAQAASYLVPFSFRRLDAFSGYQSGMPSPGYYQRLWAEGPRAAGDGLMADVAARLRARHQPTSTADLISARVMAEGLARLRGNAVPARTDILDGLASALVTEALDVPLPWGRRGTIQAATDPVIVEMVAALSGDATGRLAEATPLPPLWHDVDAQIARCALSTGKHRMSLLSPSGVDRSRVLHRLRVLSISGFHRLAGPWTGSEEVLDETWRVDDDDMRQSSVIEASGFGATLHDAAMAALTQRAADVGTDPVAVASSVLLDAALCGLSELTGSLVDNLRAGIGRENDLASLGVCLSAMLTLWRHDRVLGSAGGEGLGAAIRACVPRIMWLVEGLRAIPGRDPGDEPPDRDTVGALVSARDAVLSGPAGIDRAAVLAVCRRTWHDHTAGARLRGAALGLCWCLGDAPADAGRLVRGSARPAAVGDWLFGLFALARDEAIDEPAVMRAVDEVVTAMGPEEFLVSLPGLREAFSVFPPAERQSLAGVVLGLHGHAAAGASSLVRRQGAAPELIAEAAAVEARAEALLAGAGLLDESGPVDRGGDDG